MTAQEYSWNTLDWDTQFFGVPTARIAQAPASLGPMETLLADISAAGGQVVHYLINAHDQAQIKVAEAAGFHHVDTRITLRWPNVSLSSSPLPPTLGIRQATDDDQRALESIARTSYHLTRYYYDGHYNHARCDDMYAEWLTRSYREAHVLVAEQAGAPVGFITCELSAATPEGTIGLVGVAEQARGFGVGSFLVQAAQQWFQHHQVAAVLVVTQGRNIAAQRIYQRAGFVSHQFEYWYHKWLSQ